MKKASENQGSTRAFAEYLSPKGKVMDHALQQHSPHFASYPQETPMKPSQVTNRLSHPPPRRVLPLQTPEQCNKDRYGPQLHPTCSVGPMLSSGFAPNSATIIASPVNSLPNHRVVSTMPFVQPPGLTSSSPANTGNLAYGLQPTTRERWVPLQHTVQSGPTHFSSSRLVPVSPTNNNTSTDKPPHTLVFHNTSSKLVKDLYNHFPSHHAWRDQGTESKVTSSNSGSSNETSQRQELNKSEQQQHEQAPSSAKLIQEGNLNCASEKRRRELEHCDENSRKPCPQGSNSGKTQTSKPIPGDSLVPAPASKNSSVLEPSPKTTDGHLHPEPASEQSEIPSTLKSTQSPCMSSPKHCVKRVPSGGTKQVCIDFIQKNVVKLSAPSKSSEESLKRRNEENDERDKSSSSAVHQKDSSRSPCVATISHSSGLVACSTPVLPAKTLSKSNQSEESRKSHSNTSKLTSKSNLGSPNCHTVERNKAARVRRSIPDDISDLFTPDPMTYVVSPVRKTAKLKIEGEEIKSPTSEKGSTPGLGDSTPSSGSSLHKTPQATVKESPNAMSSSAPSSPACSPVAKCVKLERSRHSSKDKGLRIDPIASSGRQLKDENVKPDEKRRPLLSSSVNPLGADAAVSEQTSSSRCTRPLPPERQANEGSRKEVNEEDPIDVEVDLGLSIAYDVDLTQSSDSSEEEQLISLKEMMERVTKPPDTPEKGAFSEPSTPVQRRCQPKTLLSSTTKSGVYKNNLDQMLKEINNNKRAKEVEAQLLTACKEDLLKIAEYEKAEEHREEGISSEQQEFLQRYSLMSSAIREVPPGEVVFNLEKFGRVFDQHTLQLRQCLVCPQGTAQKTLLWSSPAQLRLHLNIGLFQEAYDFSSPCPAQVTRFLFKMMSVHSERMVSEKILQALCDIACSAAYQIVKNGSQQFEVWVPSLADVTLALMNMGVDFVTLFPFEDLQPSFTEGDLLEDVYVKDESPSTEKEQPTFPEHNCSNVLKYLSYCMGLCPRAYSDDELLLLLTVVGRVSLDVNRILQSSVDVTCLQYKIVNNIRDWSAMLPRICRALTELTDDHHNMCLVVQLLPDNTRGKELRRHLSLSMISKLLNGNCTYEPSQDEFQLADLRPYLPQMQPSALLRSMHHKDKEEDFNILDQQAYYLCYSLLTLTNEASNLQLFPAHQKEQLLFLSCALETHVKCDIRESEKCLYRSKVKDLLARMYTKWQMLLKRTRPLNNRLYDFWQPVDTFRSCQEDDTATEEEDEEEEETILSDEMEDDVGMVAEEEEREEEVTETEEAMEVDERPGDAERDATKNDTSKTEEVMDPVSNDLSQVMPDMQPQAVDEQMDANITEYTDMENETDSGDITPLLASGFVS
ncbi:SMC5-SMC6 complex localization factor protein 2 isoform X2 [Leuresthes tenuis]|uniref:SMC5-SMC6 complex localization factor protein 2 isoform X2 n=1 Tax=Leuresthes tenuis TaxID=355514 RepID=UPI003B50F8EB